MFASSPPEEDVDAFRVAMLGVHPIGFRAMARASAEDLGDVPPTVRVPTLLVYGDRDERSPLTVAEDLHATLRRSTLVVLQGVGHLCNIEAAERFNCEVGAFLAEHHG